MEYKYWLFLFGSVLVSSISQILLKKGAMRQHSSFIKEYMNFHVIIGYGLMVVSTLLCIMAYSGLAYKNGPIIESLGYLLVMIFSAIFLSERITKKKVIGNLVILVGIAVFYLF